MAGPNDHELDAGQPLREVIFGGKDVARLLSQNIKLGTFLLENPKYDDIVKGQKILANCNHANESIPLRVLDIIRGQLRSFPLPLLVLDGYFSHEEAAGNLQGFSEGTTVTQDTRFIYFLTINEQRFAQLPISQIQKILTQPVTQLLYAPEMRSIFFRAFYTQGVERKGWKVEGFVQFLEEQHLLTSHEVENIQRWLALPY